MGEFMNTALRQNLQGRLAMTFSLGQALVMLELPQAELSTWLLAEIEKNPLLELDSLSSSLPFKDVSQIEAPKTL